MLIIGIDPSIRATGICVLDDGREIRLTTLTHFDYHPDGRILADHYDTLDTIFAYHYELDHPIILAVESVFFSKDPKTLIRLSEIQGVLKLLAYYYNAKFKSVSPTTVKKWAKGENPFLDCPDLWAGDRYKRGPLVGQPKILPNKIKVFNLASKLTNTPMTDHAADALVIAHIVLNE